MSILSATRRPRALRPARPGVPWLTVATLALGLSCTTAFWLVSLEGAIGSPQRFATPFATWLMLVVTLLPFFGAGVLAMLMLARHWFGPEPRFPDKVAITGLLLAAGGTLLGIAALAVSAVYDYHLQVPHIGGMQGMAPCTGSCVPREQHEIFVLHVRGVWMVGRWLLLSNAVLVTWLVAMWGGRIRLATGSVDEDPSVDHETAGERDPLDDVRRVLVGALAGAAVIHAAVVREHLDEWTAAGVFFIVLTTAEAVVAGLFLRRRPGRVLLLGAAVLSVAPLVAWLWSRTLGLPFGPEPGVAEAVGVPDVLACALEVLALVAVWGLLHPGRLARPSLSPHGRGLAVLALIAVTAIGFAATGPSWFDAFGVSAAHSTMEMSA